MESVPDKSVENTQIWTSSVPLLCYSVMEIHAPERVLRQFGLIQIEPIDRKQYDHRDGRGRWGTDWTQVYAEYIQWWNESEEHVYTPPDQDINEEELSQ